MKYTDWNDLLYHYYFDDANDSVFLFIDKDSLLQYALESQKFDEEIAIDEKKKCRFYNDEDKLKFIWENFCLIFINKETDSGSLKFFCDLFSQKIRCSKQDIPQVFPFIAICLMPFEESKGLNANNFHRRVKRFLVENKIIQSNIDTGTFGRYFRQISGIIKMWDDLGKWAEKRRLPYSPKYAQGSRKDYVSPFRNECLITPTIRQRFSVLFKNMGFAPHQDYNFHNNQIKNSISNHYRDLGISETQKDYYIKEFPNIIIDEFKRAYAKWNGECTVVKREGGRRIRTDYGTVHNLFLTMQSILGNYSFFLRIYAPKIERGEHIELNHKNEILDTRIGIDGFGQKPILKDNTDLYDALRNQEKIELTENAQNKSVFIPMDFFLFQQKGMEFTSACSLILGAHFFFLKRNDCNKYDEWLEKNQSVLIQKNIKNSGYNLYNIPKVLVSFPEIPKLSFDDKKSAALVNTQILYSDKNIYYVYNGFPAYFTIGGIDVTSNVIATTYDSNDVAKNHYQLEYCPESNLWKMPVIQHFFDKERVFRLFHNGEILSNYKFAFRGLPDITNETFTELRYNKWGLYDPNGEFKGLTIPHLDGSGIPDAMKKNMESTGQEPPKGLDSYEATDYILYFLSSHPERATTKSEFKNMLKVLIQNNNIDDNDVDNNYKVTRLLNNYCRLGFINYFYYYDKELRNTGEPHKIAINRPTLVMLPPRFEMLKENGIRRLVCKESWYKFLLSGARTPEFINKLINNGKAIKDVRIQISKSASPLYPHEIIIWSNTESAIKELAKRLRISLQFCVYSEKLLRRLGDIESYISNVEDKELRVDNVSSYRVIDFLHLNDIDIDKEYVVPTKREIDRTCDMVCYWPNTGYSEEYVLWRQEKKYPLEKFWSNYVGAYFKQKRIIKIDNYHIITPYYFRLPVIYDRALTLISGKLPEVIYVNGWRQYLDYSLYDSPFIRIDSSLIANKLQQQ